MHNEHVKVSHHEWHACTARLQRVVLFYAEKRALLAVRALSIWYTLDGVSISGRTHEARSLRLFVDLFSFPSAKRSAREASGTPSPPPDFVGRYTSAHRGDSDVLPQASLRNIDREPGVQFSACCILILSVHLYAGKLPCHVSIALHESIILAA